MRNKKAEQAFTNFVHSPDALRRRRVPDLPILQLRERARRQRAQRRAGLQQRQRIGLLARKGVAAEHMAGADTMPVEYDFIPRATYCQPQIGSMGLSEAQARDAGYVVKVASFPFAANGKAQGLGDSVGFVKIVADAAHNEILGAHLIGPDVTALLPILNAAQTWDLTADELSRVVFAHPTLGEAVKEALHGIAGHMINF